MATAARRPVTKHLSMMKLRCDFLMNSTKQTVYNSNKKIISFHKHDILNMNYVKDSGQPKHFQE